MLFSIMLFALSWICFMIFADKKKLWIYSPTCYVAMILGLTTDVMTDSYGLWEYPSATLLQSFWRHTLDDFGVYFVITYLFLQELPKEQSVFTVSRHIFIWSLVAISIEYIALKTGNLKHQMWWNLGYSYVADWILYLIFYGHHIWRGKHTGHTGGDQQYG